MSAPTNHQQPQDAPPSYGSPPSTFEQPRNLDGQPEGGPHVMSSSDQNRGNDPEAEKLVREFEAYDFGNDGEFRKGLPAILKQAKGKTTDIDTIIGRAQWFYFNKLRGVSVPFDVYRRYRTGELESRPMGTSKKFGSLMSGGQGGSSSASSSDAQPQTSSGQQGQQGQQGQTQGSGPSPAGAIGAAAGGATSSASAHGSAPAAPGQGQHGEGISVVSAEDDVAVTRAATVVESSGVRTSPSSAVGGSGSGEATNDMPFEQVVRLIQEGRANEVPRKEIPDGVNLEPASESKMAPRRKPWETGTVAGSSGGGGGDDKAVPAYSVEDTNPAQQQQQQQQQQAPQQ